MNTLADVYSWRVWVGRTVIAVCQIMLGSIVAFGGAVFVICLAWQISPWMLLLACVPVPYRKPETVTVAFVPVPWGIDQIIKAFPALSPRFSDAPGTASFGNRRHVREHRLLNGGSNDIYCGTFKQQPVYYSGDRHIVTVGPTRSGKDTSLLIPNLMRLNRSVVVIDPKGEAAAVTARFRATLGTNIIINPFGVLPDRSDLKSSGFNPLAGFDVKSSDFFARSMGTGEAMHKLEDRNPHWNHRSRALTTALVMRSKWYEEEQKKPATMDNVMAMLTLPYSSPDEKALTLQSVAMQIGQHHYEPMAKLARSFGVSGSKEVMDVIATALGQTGFLNDDRLMADMKKHPAINGKPFDFEMLKHEIITVYIILPADKLSTHAVWLRLVVASALNALKRSGPGPVRPVLMLNEVGNLGHLEPLESGMGIAAGMGVTLWTVWQSLAQISKIYGHEGREAFLSGAGVLNSFKAGDMETAEYISRRLGKRTEIVTNYNVLPGTSKTTAKSENPHGFPLMHPENLIALKKGDLISWIEPSSRAFRLNAPGYWEMKALAGRFDRNPYYGRA